MRTRCAPPSRHVRLAPSQRLGPWHHFGHRRRILSAQHRFADLAGRVAGDGLGEHLLGSQRASLSGSTDDLLLADLVLVGNDGGGDLAPLLSSAS